MHESEREKYLKQLLEKEKKDLVKKSIITAY